MNKPTVLSYYICDECKKPITDYNDGFHIVGNVSLADPNAVKGIIGSGDWLMKIDRGERPHPDTIPEIALHKICFYKLLGIQISHPR